MENVSTKEQAAAIKKALVPVFGRENVSVKKGTGTASHWIHTNVEIPVPAGCTCERPGSSWGDKMCATCRAEYKNAEEKMNKIANETIAKLGGFSSYYSDDYSDSKPYDCHLAQVRFIRPCADCANAREYGNHRCAKHYDPIEDNARAIAQTGVGITSEQASV